MEQDHNKISINRSDGVTHDLVSVFSKLDTSSLKEPKKIPTPTQLESSKDSSAEDHIIVINRSDDKKFDINSIARLSNSKSEADSSSESGKMSSPTANLSTSPQPSSAKLRSKSWTSKGRLSFNMLSSLIGEQTGGGGMAGSQSSKSVVPISSGSGFGHLAHPKVVRIVHMSDSSGFLASSSKFRNFLPEGDILVHTGNFTCDGDDEEFSRFDAWLASVKDKYHYRIVCLGDRDVLRYGVEWEVFRVLLPNATHVLCHSEATVLGIKFYGCPWHWGHSSNYSLKTTAPASTSTQFSEIPNDINVLITHGPAYGRLDKTFEGENWGSRELLDAIIRVKPGLHLHGHIPESRGLLYPFGHFPLTANSSLCDKFRNVLCQTAQVIKCSNLASSNNGERDSENNKASSSKASAWLFEVDSLC